MQTARHLPVRCTNSNKRHSSWPVGNFMPCSRSNIVRKKKLKNSNMIRKSDEHIKLTEDYEFLNYQLGIDVFFTK
jgi:hypothetical protein